jgi:hypothetical protein
MAINRAVKKHNLQFAKLYRVEAGQQPVWRVVLPAPAPANIAGQAITSELPASPTSLASTSLPGSSLNSTSDFLTSTMDERTAAFDGTPALPGPTDATLGKQF